MVWSPCQSISIRPAWRASRAALEARGSPRARAIVVAHLFGGRVDLEPILAWARPRGIVVIEDCAQAFASPSERGDPRSDVAMFSFGSIKTATALGGALLRVTDRRLLAAIRSRQARWPVASRGRYAAKIVKYSFLKLLACPPVFSAFVAACRVLGGDYNQLLNRWVRGFARSNLLDRLRHQPSAPLLEVLRRRLERSTPSGSAVAPPRERFCRSPSPAVPPFSAAGRQITRTGSFRSRAATRSA